MSRQITQHGPALNVALGWFVMSAELPPSPPSQMPSAGPRLRRPLVLAAGVLIVLVTLQVLWPSWQRSQDLQRLVQAGAIFDTRSDTPSWMRLVGATFDNVTLESLARITTLEDLVLDESNISDTDLKLLSTLTRLKRFSLARTPITDNGLVHLSELPVLTTLILNSSYHVTDKGLETLGRMKHLEDVSLLDTTVTLPGLVSLSGRHRTLQINSPHGVLGDRKLALSGTEITDDGLLRLYNARQLQGVELPQRITDRGFRHLHGLTELKYLVAAGTTITDQGLRELLAQTPPLVEVDFSNCRRLTDAGLAQLATLPQLTQLKADQTAAGPRLITAISQSSRLESLSLVNCRGIDGEAIAGLIKSPALKKLRFLMLRGTGITDATIETLTPAHSPNLKGLDLRDTRLSTDAVSRLKRRLTGCQIIN